MKLTTQLLLLWVLVCTCKTVVHAKDIKPSAIRKIVSACTNQCPPGSKRSKSCVCVCNSAKKFYNSATNTCDRKIVSACTNQCPPDSKRSKSCECVCNSAKKFYNSATNTCDHCRLNCVSPQQPDVGCTKCECPNTCPDNAQITSTCECPCNDPYAYKELSNTCECPSDCPSSAVRSEPCSCKCISPLYSYNTETNTCDLQCPVNSVLSGDTCVCDAPKIYNSASNACECLSNCPSGATIISGTCGCLCTSTFYTYNTEKNTCDLQCPANSKPSGDTCTCDSPYTFKSGSNNCECPSDCPPNAARSEPCSCTCILTFFNYNTETNTCVLQCPANFLPSGDTCTCKSPYIYKSESNTCVQCSSPMSRQLADVIFRDVTTHPDCGVNLSVDLYLIENNDFAVRNIIPTNWYSKILVPTDKKDFVDEVYAVRFDNTETGKTAAQNFYDKNGCVLLKSEQSTVVILASYIRLITESVPSEGQAFTFEYNTNWNPLSQDIVDGITQSQTVVIIASDIGYKPSYEACKAPTVPV